MAQQIIEHPGSIFGRLGSNLGKGLADQLPKEIERSRLSSGLKSFEEEHKQLSPIQQLARLSSIPGITPQMIQSFSELARFQNQGDAFRGGQQPGQGAPESAGGVPAQPGSRQPGGQTSAVDMAMKGVSGGTPNVPRDQYSPSQIMNENPLSESTLAVPPWNPTQRDQSIVNYLNKGFLPDKAQQLAADDEARYLASPEAFQKRQDQLKKKQVEARDELVRQLETKLQKKGEDLFKDISGDMMIAFERGMERDLRENDKATVNDVANDWSQRALNVAKAKTQLNEFMGKTGWEAYFKGDEAYKNLKEYQDIFKQAGDEDEFYNIIRDGFGLSPQGAATIAYPMNKKLKKEVANYKPLAASGHNLDRGLIASKARDIAKETIKHITPNDSVLAIARYLSDKDPLFDQQTFFDQIREDKESLRLNPRQQKELAEGPKGIIPYWGDIKIIPDVSKR